MPDSSEQVEAECVPSSCTLLALERECTDAEREPKKKVPLQVAFSKVTENTAHPFPGGMIPG